MMDDGICSQHVIVVASEPSGEGAVIVDGHVDNDGYVNNDEDDGGGGASRGHFGWFLQSCW